MTKEELMMKQQYDLDLKIQLSLVRIREFYYRNNKKVYVSFSGGKDSTVLLHLVRSEFPDVPAVFCNTGNEYPDIIKFVNTIDNVITIRPKLSLKEVIEKYGYPVISKEISEHIYSIRNYRLTEESIKRANKKIPKKWKFLLNAPFKISDLCCDYLKKNPFIKFEKETGLKPYIGLMASDSLRRRQEILRHNCNVFDCKRPRSRPLAFWTEKDIWDYINKYNVKISDIYYKGHTRTGCMFCGFGLQFLNKDGKNKYELMLEQYPQIANYFYETLGFKKVLEYIMQHAN